MALQLHVRSLGGHMTSLPADPSWTAHMVKQTLEAMIQVPASDMKLFMSGHDSQELLNSDVLGAIPESVQGAIDLSWVEATPWPAFALDDALLREAEEAASRFVTFNPWNNGFLDLHRGMLPPNAGSPLGLGVGFSAAGPEILPGGHFGHPGIGGADPDSSKGNVMAPAYGNGWQPEMQVMPPEFVWSGTAPGTGGPMIGAGLAPPVPMGGMPHGTAPAPMIVPPVNPVPTSVSQLPPAPVAAAPATAPPTSPPVMQEPVKPTQSSSPSSSKASSSSPPREQQGPKLEGTEEKCPVAISPAPESAKPSPKAAATGAGSPPEASKSVPTKSEGPPPKLPEGPSEVAQTPKSGLPSPKSNASPTGNGATSGNGWKSDFCLPVRTWANVVTKEKDSQDAAARQDDVFDNQEDEIQSKKDSIIDYLLLLATHKSDSAGKNNNSLDLSEDLRKYKQAAESGVSTNNRVKYIRRGMKNESNICYVNVVIQSLLPCSALMQLLSHCTADADRPFYTGMIKLCKEFHSRKPSEISNEALNVLGLTQVKKIISTWQQLGAQQDAGEFLFHLLNGLHEESKWKTIPDDGLSPKERGGNGAWGGQAKQDEGHDVRSAGEHEDSPIFRIFGGIIRSSVQTKNAKADSVSLEPFNGLTLDISSTSVDSVWSALEAYCSNEAVNEGRATRRLQFKVVPKVMILNLKRFSYNKDTGCPEKISKNVKFEEKLTLDRSWLVDDVETQEYQLTAVICHHGDLITGGHYNAAVRYNSDWYMYDDVSVRQIDIREVTSQLGGSVYLLLYQCTNKIDIRP